MSVRKELSFTTFGWAVGAATGFPPGVPMLRLFFPAGHSVEPWPPRCDCDLPIHGAAKTQLVVRDAII